MNKIIIFIPTGEVRPPKKWEWFYSIGGNFVKAVDVPTEQTHYIFTRHEIEVPENAEAFYYRFFRPFVQVGEERVIHLPKPKVKVKKWKWVVPCSNWLVGPCTEDHVKELILT